MPKAAIEVRGKRSSWEVCWDASQSQIDAMREDGIEVDLIENSMPMWIVDIGMARVWCFFQDIWNFKNPFKGWKDV